MDVLNMFYIPILTHINYQTQLSNYLGQKGNNRRRAEARKRARLAREGNNMGDGL